MIINNKQHDFNISFYKEYFKQNIPLEYIEMKTIRNNKNKFEFLWSFDNFSLKIAIEEDEITSYYSENNGANYSGTIKDNDFNDKQLLSLFSTLKAYALLK